MSPVATSVGARPVVKVGAAELSERIAAALRTTIVDTDADGPDSCRLVIDDPTRELLADSDLDLAAELTITAGRVGENSGDTLFDGVVYAIGFDYDDRGGYTTVTAYDRSYGLYNGLHTTSFQNMTDGDIAKQIARDVGLTAGDVATTTVLHEHVSQVNETHIEFLERRGREVGCVVVVSGSTLHFRPSTPAADAPAPGAYDSADRLQLVPGQEPPAPDRAGHGRPAGLPGGGPRLGHVDQAGARRHHGRPHRDGEPAGHARVGRRAVRQPARGHGRPPARPAGGVRRRGRRARRAPGQHQRASPRGSPTATRTWSPVRP